MKRLAIPILLTIIISVALMAVVQRLNLTPVLAGRQGHAIDALFRLLISLAVVIFTLCMVFLAYSLIAFRRQPGDMEDALPIAGFTPLEIAWTVAPLIIVLSLATYSAGVLIAITRASEKELEVKVTGFQWAWRFEYPELGITSSKLVLPVNRPVLFRVRATDVIHSFWVPEFRVKLDAIPGIENELRVTPTKVGQYKVRCAEMCGTGHAYMLAPVEVVEESAFAQWVQANTVPARVETAPAGIKAQEVEKGKQYARQFGCLACHSVDGSALVGPSWKGLYGSTATFQDGTTAQADEDYLRDSILNPGRGLYRGIPM